MASVAPRSVVGPPTRLPVQYGLGSVVTWRPGDRWESGVTWEHLTCQPVGGRGGPECEETIPGTPHMETLSITGGVPTSGDFQIGRIPYWTGPIAYNATAQQVQNRLALANIPDLPEGIVATGGPLPETPVVLTWPNTGVVSTSLTTSESTLDAGTPEITVTAPGTDDETTGGPVGLPKPIDDFPGPSIATADPFVVYGEYSCNPIGGPSFTEAQEYAEAHLNQGEIARVEQAVWTGDLGNTPNLVSTGQEIMPGYSVAIREAIAYFEFFIGENYNGAGGVIHLTRGDALLGLSRKVIEARGGRLFTRLGTPVIAGTGYDGSGPTGSDPLQAGQSWGYVTPAMLGYRGDVLTSSSRPGDLLDRGNNVLYAIAEREYLVGWDNCPVGAVLIHTPVVADGAA